MGGGRQCVPKRRPRRAGASAAGPPRSVQKLKWEMGDISSSCHTQIPLLRPVPVVTGRQVVVGGDGVPPSCPTISRLPHHPVGSAAACRRPGWALPKAIFSIPWPGIKLGRTAGGWKARGRGGGTWPGCVCPRGRARGPRPHSASSLGGEFMANEPWTVSSGGE